MAGAGASKLNLASCLGQNKFPARSGTKNGQNRTDLEHTLAAYLGGELGHSTGCLEGFVGLENVEPAGKQLCQGGGQVMEIFFGNYARQASGS